MRTSPPLLQRAWRWLFAASYFVPGSNDVYIASFPRSGNTWLRAIFGALVSGGEVSAIVDLDQLVPEEGVPVLKRHLVKREFHFVKTHEPYRFGKKSIQSARGVIYVVRDPRDVVLSHFEYMKNLYDYRDSFEDFVSDWLAGRIYPGAWSEHVRGWTEESATSPARISVLRYEDARADCEKEIGRICHERRLDFDAAAIKAAVAQAAIGKMRTKESRGMRATEKAPNFRFVGRGESGGWRTRLSPAANEQICETCSVMMSRFGYS